VLLIAPAAMGTVFLLARVWDGVSDPMAGYLSDLTNTRIGRRRPWLLAAALPIAAVAVMPWQPPAGLEGFALVVWAAAGLLAFETISTMFNVPHTALGAELSMDHHERTRVFSFRFVATGLGFVLAAGAIFWMARTDEPRVAALWLTAGGGLVSTGLLLLAGLRLREPGAHAGRGARRPLRAWADVLRNPHARLLLGVFLIESLGGATLGILGAYLAQYVLGDQSVFSPLLGCYFGAGLLFVPAIAPLSRRLGKKNTWLAGMVVTGVGFLLLFYADPSRLWIIYVAAVMAGAGGMVGSTVGPSVQADVIDYDEHATGERKEGTYFAVWNFTRKCAAGIMGLLTGLVLQLVGFEPNVDQGEGVLFAIRALAGLFPAGAYLVGALLFRRFALTEAEHARVRADLDSAGPRREG
jgi:Na+/melibiose symporter-like transporter